MIIVDTGQKTKKLIEMCIREHWVYVCETQTEIRRAKIIASEMGYTNLICKTADKIGTIYGGYVIDDFNSMFSGCQAIAI